jgi:hypothetical protein
LVGLAEIMETHAHHLHHAPGKKFRHYFFEFLMLFIAVFSGFVAENYRETIVEHHREKEYMQSMVEDLKQDIISIDTCVASNERDNAETDTMLDILEKPSLDKKDIADLYRHFSGSTYGQNASFSQRTLAQLKNSGMMRLIRKHDISDSLNVYDSNIETIQSIFKTVDEQTTLVMNTSCTIFDFSYRRTRERKKELTDGKIIPVLLTNDSKALKVLSNYASVVKAVKEIQSRVLLIQKSFAGRLIQTIKNEYHLE